MKIAISGKGGVGKSTIAGALALYFAQKGNKVLALDADPDANLARALGIPDEEQKNIVPISRQIALIEERTGAKVAQYGQIFKMNPEVKDVADGYAYPYKGVSLLVLGAIKAGGSGCACPENTFIKALVTDLVLYKNETLIMDMEAGIEHLGRATASGVDVMIVVVEPGQRSVDCAKTILRMTKEIGLKNVVLVGNKAANQADEDFIRDSLPGQEIITILPYSEAVRSADRDGKSVLDGNDAVLSAKLQQLFAKIEDI
ncbi:MAG TPA: AAA family ATPase [Oscillospiraceae bacterium]|nr:AAA family ATPase [Oscillospiraceae bacterium]HPS34789.1 AAA family ATPase [Oscillospiraceae bacterium]